MSIKMIFEGAPMTFKSVPDIERRLKLTHLFLYAERDWILRRKNEGVTIHACFDPFAQEILGRNELIMATDEDTLERLYQSSLESI